jgi:hypothetical protein
MDDHHATQQPKGAFLNAEDSLFCLFSDLLITILYILHQGNR